MRIGGIVTAFNVDMTDGDIGVAIWFEDEDEERWSLETVHRSIDSIDDDARERELSLILHSTSQDIPDRWLGHLRDLMIDEGGLIMVINIDGVEHVVWGSLATDRAEIFLAPEEEYERRERERGR
jgi:hypothetical protein